LPLRSDPGELGLGFDLDLHPGLWIVDVAHFLQPLEARSPEELRAVEQELGALPMSGERDFAEQVASGVTWRPKPATWWARFVDWLP
jgi:hypothetical protein